MKIFLAYGRDLAWETLNPALKASKRDEVQRLKMNPEYFLVGAASPKVLTKELESGSYSALKI